MDQMSSLNKSQVQWHIYIHIQTLLIAMYIILLKTFILKALIQKQFIK